MNNEKQAMLNLMDGHLLDADIAVDYALSLVEDAGWKPNGRYGRNLKRAMVLINNVRRAVEDKLDKEV